MDSKKNDEDGKNSEKDEAGRCDVHRSEIRSIARIRIRIIVRIRICIIVRIRIRIVVRIRIRIFVRIRIRIIVRIRIRISTNSTVPTLGLGSGSTAKKFKNIFTILVQIFLNSSQRPIGTILS